MGPGELILLPSHTRTGRNGAALERSTQEASETLSGRGGAGKPVAVPSAVCALKRRLRHRLPGDGNRDGPVTPWRAGAGGATPSLPLRRPSRSSADSRPSRPGNEGPARATAPAWAAGRAVECGDGAQVSPTGAVSPEQSMWQRAAGGASVTARPGRGTHVASVSDAALGNAEPSAPCGGSSHGKS